MLTIKASNEHFDNYVSEWSWLLLNMPMNNHIHILIDLILKEICKEQTKENWTKGKYILNMTILCIRVF